MSTGSIRVGVAAFSHAPEYDSTPEREAFVRREHDALCSVLSAAGFEVVSPLVELRRTGSHGRFGISTSGELDFTVDAMRAAKVHCLVASIGQWPRIALISSLVTSLDVPSALYASTDPAWSVGEVTSGAAAASILEAAPTRNALLVERFRDTEREAMVRWLRGTGALQLMRRGRLLMWGGAFGADVPATRDDEAALENRFVREIILEEEFVLVEGARAIVKKDPARVERFVSWLRGNGVGIHLDGKMLTEEVLAFSAGHYLAARDRLAEMAGENVIGTSVKCHFEVSTKCVGCTLCLIPGFLPFASDSEGERAAVPVACEGDLKALLTMTMLQSINPKAAPLFGDTIWFKEDSLLLSNCGSSSVYWAGRSMDPRVSLPHVHLMPQLHGKSGSSVFYVTPGGKVTYARLFRVKGRYFMYLGLGEVPEEKRQIDRAPGWPQTRVRFATDPALLYRTAPSNHGCLTDGDVTAEVESFCRQAGVAVVRCDSNASLERHLEQLAAL
jgi:L-fucose/D-arabinose isomerase